MSAPSRSNKFSKLTWLKSLHGADITNGEYRVLVTVFDYTSENGTNGHPGIERIAADTNMSARTVERAIKALKAKGWLVQRSKGSGYARRASVFDLAIPALSVGNGADDIPDTSVGNGADDIPDTSVGIDDPHTRHSVSPYPTKPAHIPDTHVGPSDPGSDPQGSDPEERPSDHASPQEADKDQPLATDVAAMEEEPTVDQEVPEEAVRIAADLTREIFQSDPWAVSPWEQWENERQTVTTETVVPVSTMPQPWETKPDWATDLPKQETDLVSSFDPFEDYHRPTLGGSYRPAVAAGNDPPAGS